MAKQAAGDVASLSVQSCLNEQPTIGTDPTSCALAPNAFRLLGDAEQNKFAVD